jgi:4-oxalocrotonate tautomerase
MPFIHVHIAAGRPLEKRRRLAAAITDVVTEILELDRDATQVIVQQHERDSWAIGGELLSERRAAPRDDDDALPDLDRLFRKPSPKKTIQKSPAKRRSRR